MLLISRHLFIASASSFLYFALFLRKYLLLPKPYLLTFSIIWLLCGIFAILFTIVISRSYKSYTVKFNEWLQNQLVFCDADCPDSLFSWFPVLSLASAIGQKRITEVVLYYYMRPDAEPIFAEQAQSIVEREGLSSPEVLGKQLFSTLSNQSAVSSLARHFLEQLKSKGIVTTIGEGTNALYFATTPSENCTMVKTDFVL